MSKRTEYDASDIEWHNSKITASRAYIFSETSKEVYLVNLETEKLYKYNEVLGDFEEIKESK